MRSSHLRSILAVLVTFASLPAELAGQDTAIIDSLVAADTTIGPIPIASIATEAVDAAIELRSMREHAQLDGLLDEINAAWSARQDAVKVLNDEAAMGIAGRTDPGWLAEIERQWVGVESDLAGWLGTLSDRAEELTDELMTLGSMKRQWSDTRNVVTSSDFPPIVLANVDSLLSRMETLGPALQSRLNDVLELQGVLALERQNANHIIEQIGNQDASELRSFVRRDNDPLWGELFGLEDEFPDLVDDRSYSGLYFSSISQYIKNNWGYVWIHAALFLFLLWLSRKLQVGVGTWNKERPETEVDTTILSRSFSAALLVSLLSTELIYPSIPLILVGLSLVFSILPAYRLLTIKLPHPLHRLLQVFLGFLLTFLTAETLVPEQAVSGRFVFLILITIAVGGLGWFLRDERISEVLKESSGGRKVLFGIRAAFLILAASVAADVFGFTGLARHLTGATVNSTYFLLLIYIGSTVLIALSLGLLKSPFAHGLKIVNKHFGTIAERLVKLINVVAGLLAIYSVLDAFGVYRGIYDWAEALLTDPISIGEAELSIGDIVLFVVIFYLALLLARLIRFVLQEELLSRVQLSRGVPAAISGTTFYVLVSLGFILALSATGVPMDRFTILAGAFGVGLGFGMQNIIGNFVSGLILLYESPIQVGDTIEFGTRTGVVKHIGIRSSRVRTFDGAEVNVPNSSLVANEVTNWTMHDTTRRLSIDFGVAYGTDPSTIPDLIIPLAVDHPLVDRHPAPIVLFTTMADSSLNFQLRCWTGSGDWPIIKSDLTRAIYHALGDAGIEIPFPQTDLHVRSVDSDVLNSGRPTSNSD
ncbi:MAG: mechanosensitive ion channel family protein [Rhodothermia bacterium]